MRFEGVLPKLTGCFDFGMQEWSSWLVPARPWLSVAGLWRIGWSSRGGAFKVSRAGFHLLLAFSTEEKPDGLYSLTGFKVLDLYGLDCRLKLEFNASNRDLYDPARGLIVVEE